MLSRKETFSSFAIGVGSVLSIFSAFETTELPPLSQVEAENNINQYWNNVGGYIQHSMEELDINER